MNNIRMNYYYLSSSFRSNRFYTFEVVANWTVKKKKYPNEILYSIVHRQIGRVVIAIAVYVTYIIVIRT